MWNHEKQQWLLTEHVKLQLLLWDLVFCRKHTQHLKSSRQRRLIPAFCPGGPSRPTGPIWPSPP